MEIRTSNELESTGYRCLFECVKQEGIEPVLGLVQDINNLPDKDILISQTIMSKENDLVKLAKKNKDVIRYLKEHKNELIKLSFTNQDVFNTLISLSKNSTLIDLYLENARKLEKLMVKQIRFKNIVALNESIDTEKHYFCQLWLNDEKKLEYIKKCYTDGEVIPVLTEEEANNFDWCRWRTNNIPYRMYIGKKFSFVLIIDNNIEKFREHRAIEIMDFGFDGSKLPTEEEVQSYEIPRELIKKIR